ncbi:MAG TPA: hypothetical protein VK338_02255 [Candidatus Nitrosocosmicus sp.]|nr:hypothetical protein [Candidatus Nitrosocosmicus sp.]
MSERVPYGELSNIVRESENLIKAGHIESGLLRLEIVRAALSHYHAIHEVASSDASTHVDTIEVVLYEPDASHDTKSRRKTTPNASATDNLVHLLFSQKPVNGEVYKSGRVAARFEKMADNPDVDDLNLLLAIKANPVYANASISELAALASGELSLVEYCRTHEIDLNSVAGKVNSKKNLNNNEESENQDPYSMLEGDVERALGAYLDISSVGFKYHKKSDAIRSALGGKSANANITSLTTGVASLTKSIKNLISNPEKGRKDTRARLERITSWLSNHPVYSQIEGGINYDLLNRLLDRLSSDTDNPITFEELCVLTGYEPDVNQ